MSRKSPNAREGADNATQSILQHDPNDDLRGLLAPSDVPGSLGRLGHYEVQQILGSGGFGTVLRAFDGKLQRMVAIKLISPELATTSPARKRFLREAQASAAIRHENIVQIYNVEEQPFPYLVMEYIPGQTLETRLNEHGPLDVPEVLRLGWQIASGLAAAHARGLIHRDIKPANILLEGGRDDRVKITDFGLARAVDDASLTQSGAIAGTPLYMAPEQAQGVTLDQRADLFSLGSVLYRMVSGRPPFRAETTLAVLKRVTEDTPRPIQEIIPETPNWLCTIISRLHAKRPEDRIQTAKELADLLAQCQKALELGTTPVLPWPVLVAPPRDSNAPAQPARPTPTAASRRLAGGVLASLAAVLLLIVGLGVTEATGVTNVRGTVIQLFSPDGTLVVEVDDPGVSVSIDGEEMVITGTGVKEIRLKPGEYKLLASKDGKLVSQELVTVTRNGRRVVRVSREAGAALATGDRPKPDKGTAPGHRPNDVAPGLAGPSPFDQLRAEDIPAEDRFAWQPKELVAVLGSHRQRHLQPVDSVALSGDGRWVASVGNYGREFDGAILWDRATMNRVATLKGSRGVAFSPDSKNLACAVGGDAVHLYDVTAMPPKLWLRVPNSEHVWYVAFDSSGERLYGFREKGLQRWQLTKSKAVELPVIESANVLGKSSIDRDGTTAVLLDEPNYRPQQMADAQVWDVGGDQPRHRFAIKSDDPQQRIISVALSPDGKRLATGQQDGKLRLWDISADTPRELASLVASGNAGIASLVFTPDGQSLITVFQGGAFLLDVAQPVPTIRSRLAFPIGGSALAVSPDGKAAVIGGGNQTVTLLSLEDQTLRELLAPSGHRAEIWSIELACDGRTLVSTARDENACVWTFDGRRFVPTAQTRGGGLSSSQITPTGDYVIAGGTIFQRDPAALNPVKQLNKLPLSLSGDGKTLAVDGLGIVDIAGTLSKERLRLPVAKSPLYPALNTDGSVLAAYFDGDKHVTWWDLREPDPQARQIPCDIALLYNLKWTPDARSLIMSGIGGIVAWDWNQGQPRERRRRVEPVRAVGLAMAPDGLTFATGSVEGRVIVWETATLSPQREWTVPTHVQTVQFAPDGRHLLLGYANGVIEVLRLAPAPATVDTPKPGKASAPGHRPSGVVPGVAGLSPFDQLCPEDIPAEDRFPWQPKELVAVLGSHRQRHLQPVESAALSADGRWVASADYNSVILWDRATMNRVATVKGSRGVAFSPDSKNLACAGPGDAIHLYDLSETPPKLWLRVPNSDQVLYVAFAAGGERLYGFREKGLQRWQLRAAKAVELPAIVSENPLGKFSIDRDGTTAVLLEDRNYHPRGTAEALVWDISGDEPRQRFTIESDDPGQPIISVALCPDGNRLATGQLAGKLRVWDSTGEMPREIASVSNGNNSVGNLIYTPDGDALVVVIPNEVVVWDVAQPVPTVRSRLAFPASGFALAISSDGKAAVVAGYEQSVTVLSLENQSLRELLAPTGHRGAIMSIELARDGRTLVSSANTERVRVWTFEGIRFVPAADAPTYQTRPGLITPTGDYVIAAGTIFQIDPAKLNPVKQLNGSPLCLSGDGKTIAVDGLGIVDLAGTLSEERLRLPVANGAWFADLNTDGSVLAAYLVGGEKHVTLWDLREQDPQARQIPCDNNRVANLKWTPDGQSLILVGTGGIVAWDWNQGQPRERRRRVEPASAVGLAMAPDGLTFATGSWDGRVIVWETATLSPQREWTVPTLVKTVQFAPDGRHLLLGYGNGVIEVLRLAPAPAAAKS